MNACKTRARNVELQRKYAKKNREVKKSVKRDQRNWIDNLSYQAEDAAYKVNLKDLFAIARVLSRKQIQRNRPIKNKDGTLLTNTEEQLKCGQELFSKILYRPLDTQVDEEETEEGKYEANTRINTKFPTVIEIKKALKELRNGKAAVATTPEVMKVDLDITANMLHPLFEKIWMEGEMPKVGALPALSPPGAAASPKRLTNFA